MRTVGWVTVSATILISGYAVAALGAEGKEPEGKLVFYSTSNTADTKAVTDRFKRLYPKVDVQFERTTDSQLMEKILTEARAGKPLWDVVSTTGYYGYLLKKRGLLAAYDSPERKYFRDGFKDPQAFWTSTYTTYAVFGYNTKTVPKSTTSLLALNSGGRAEVGDSCSSNSRPSMNWSEP